MEIRNTEKKRKKKGGKNTSGKDKEYVQHEVWNPYDIFWIGWL